MRNVAIIQARSGSTRLPGKVLKTLKGRTVLGHVINRVRQVSAIDEIVIATTVLPHDDAIEQEALNHGAKVYRGSESDVLSRYYEAAAANNADTVIRITSDCPLIDPEITGEVIRHYYHTNSDYTSNTQARCFPRGLDTEVFSMESLTRAHFNAKLPEEREHVTPYIYRNPDLFHIVSFECEADYSQYRWTLDTPEDWELIGHIYSRLYTHMRPVFLWKETLQLMLEKPELSRINATVEQKKVGQ